MLGSGFGTAGVSWHVGFRSPGYLLDHGSGFGFRV